MNKKTLIVILTIFVLTIIAGGFRYYSQSQNNTDLTQNNTKQKQEQNQKGNQTSKEQQRKNNKELDFKKNDTSNWKEYCNQEYGFCVKYPEGWEYKKFASSYDKGIIFHDLVNRDNYDNTITISIAKTQENTLNTVSAWAWTINNLDEYVVNNFDSINDVKCHTGIMRINFRLKEKIRKCLTTEGGGRMHRYFIERNGKKYLLTIHFPFADDIPNDISVYKVVLESFRFTSKK